MYISNSRPWNQLQMFNIIPLWSSLRRRWTLTFSCWEGLQRRGDEKVCVWKAVGLLQLCKEEEEDERDREWRRWWRSQTWDESQGDEQRLLLVHSMRGAKHQGSRVLSHTVWNLRPGFSFFWTNETLKPMYTPGSRTWPLCSRFSTVELHSVLLDLNTFLLLRYWFTRHSK